MRNNISLSIDALSDGRFKIRWREDVSTDGKIERKARSQVVSDRGARDALVAKLRRTLETGEVYTPAVREITTAGDLEVAALAWLRWQKSRDRDVATITKYKSAFTRIFKAVRQVRGIKATENIPVTVLCIDLFAEIRTEWIKDDNRATAAKTRVNACSPMARYDLSGILRNIWAFAAGQPEVYALVPALVTPQLLLPPVPARAGPPEAPTWAECDAIVRRAYGVSLDLGDLLAGQRLTGLRIDQVSQIRRRAIDTGECSMVVEIGKSKQEKADMRKVPVPAQLLDIWSERIAACKSPDDFIFQAPGRVAGYFGEAAAHQAGPLWADAESTGEIRRNLVKPLTRRKSRPTHAFRAAYMSGLQGLTVEIDGEPVQVVRDRTIDFLVGHHPSDTRAKHYAPPSWGQLVAGVNRIPPVDLIGPDAAALPANVVRFEKATG